MKMTIIRNSFVPLHHLGFTDKTREGATRRAVTGSMHFSYNHGAPSYPGDVLADGRRLGYIEARDDETDSELQEVDVTIKGRVDDQAIVTISGGDQSYSSASGAGVTLDGSIKVKGAGYHEVSVEHINISYPPKGNVSYIDCTIDIGEANPVPVNNDPESPCKGLCPCADEEIGTESGGSSDTPSPSYLRARSRFLSAYSSTSGGSQVSRYASANDMSWSCRFGAFRGMAGLPAGRLEILARQYDPSVATPAGLAFRHPFAMSLSIPEGGIRPNQLVCLHDGASYTNYICGALGNAFFTVAASLSSQTVLAPVSALSSSPAVVCSLDEARYIRASFTKGDAVFFSRQTGMFAAYMSKFGNVVTAQEALNDLAIVREAETGMIRQIWNSWDGLADIEPDEETGAYMIAVYPPDQVMAPADGDSLFTVTGDPVRTFLVSGNEEDKSMTIVERDWTLPRSMPDFVYSWMFAGNAWSTVTGEGVEAISESRTRSELEEGRYQVETVLSKGGVVASRTLEIYADTDVGKLLLSSTEAYGTDDALTTTYAYDNLGRVISVTNPDGGTTSYRYDVQGRLVTETSPWGASGKRCVETSYRPDSDPYSSEPAQVKILLMTASSISTLRTDTYSYSTENGVKRVEVRSTAAGTSGTQLTVTETYEGSVENRFARGRLRMTQAANGVQTWHEYAATDAEGALYTETIETRVGGQAVPGQSKRTVNVISCEGNIIRSDQFVMLADASWVKISGVSNTYDDQNRLIGTLSDNGRSSSQALNCQGDLLWQINEDGIRTDYVYNSARQLMETTRSEVAYDETVITPETITEYHRDAAGRILARISRTGAMTTPERTVYDLAGRVVSQTDVLGRVTTTAYANNGALRTVTLPTGATLISALNPDGSVAHEYGTGQRELYYAYDFINGLRETVKLSDNATILSQTITDGYGQTITDTAPTTLADTYIYTRRVYNTLGQLTKQTQGNLAPETYAYNSMGQVSRQTVLLDATASSDATKNRITDYVYAYERLEDGIYQVTTSTAHNATGGNLVTVQKNLVSRLSSTLAAKTIFIDVRGNVSTQWSEYTAPNVRTTYADIPTSDVTATALSADGFTITSTDNTDVTSSFTRAWSETGMLLTSTDGRGNTTTTRTDIAGRTISVTDAAGFTTTTAYCADSDQLSVITNALGKTSCYRYDLRNRKVAEFGTAMQPSLFEYDEADNLTALTTFRVDDETLSVDPAGRTDGDTTRWDYNLATGLELVKTYPDNTQVITTYDAMNRVATVTNSRGIIQSRAYATSTGLLTSITFSDTTTPQGFVYNILGQLTQVTDAAGTRSFTYNDYTEPLTDSILVNSSEFSTEENYDDFGLSSGYLLKKGTEARQTIAYGYDSKGQLSTCSFLHSGALQSFSYTRLAGTHLLERLVSPNNMTRNYTYEEKRDLIVTLNDKRGETAVVNRSYAYNALGIPTHRTIQRQGSTRNDVFTHNDRSELTAATMGDKAFAYDYDNIGNRKTAQEEANDFTYTANALNQYTQITENDTPFVPAFDADGNQTRIKTTTGIWEAVYNALNRPLTFTRENVDGTRTVITADYDYMGRRVFKKVETVATDSETGEETHTVVSNHRFLYQGYLQIAALDLTRTTLNELWFITWDPTEPVATRPLAIQKDGTWYTYGLDLPKNITEVYGTDGYIKTAYTYSPYGLVTSTGSTVQPIQWSSEYHDTDLALVYYNYRHYNPFDGRWCGRDPKGEESRFNLLSYLNETPIREIDILGLEPSVCDKENLLAYKNFYVEIYMNTFMDKTLIASSNSAMLKSILSDAFEDKAEGVSGKTIEKAFPKVADFFESILKYSPGEKFRGLSAEGFNTASYVFKSIIIKVGTEFCCCKKGTYKFIKSTNEDETSQYNIKFPNLSPRDFARLKSLPTDFRDAAERAIRGLKRVACK